MVGCHSPFAAPVIACADGNHCERYIRVVFVEAHDAWDDFVDGAVTADCYEFAVTFLISLLHQVDGVVFEPGCFT